METFEKYLNENLITGSAGNEDMGYGQDDEDDDIDPDVQNLKRIKYKEQNIKCCALCISIEEDGDDHYCGNRQNGKLTDSRYQIAVKRNGICPKYKKHPWF